MTFDDAITNLKAGQKVRRTEWAAQNWWLELVPGAPLDADPLRLDMWMATAAGKQSILQPGWLPSELEEQSDDWQVVA